MVLLLGFADHVAFTLEFTFEDQNSEACITLNVVNDLFRELLRENLTITLDPNTNTDFLDLDVDQTPSYIVIIDDDRMSNSGFKAVMFFIIYFFSQVLRFHLNRNLFHFLKMLATRTSFLFS